MPVRPQYLAYILEQLEGVAGLRSRRMFSGVGLYSGDLFFGLIHDDTLFFKTDGGTSGEYIARGMPRFMPFATRPEAILAYHQVPADIIEDNEALQAWARGAVSVALRATRTRQSRARPTRRAVTKKRVVTARRKK
jgi:DNA transformation protein